MRLLFIVVMAFLLFSCEQSNRSAVLSMNNDVIDFGKIKIDSILRINFNFKNTGTDTLKLISASVDCGCTKVNYQREIFLPGEDGAIEVIYDPKLNNDSGLVSKNVGLRTNGVPPVKVIKIRGQVVR